MAYTFLPLGTRLYAISSQRTSKSHCGVYFPSFQNQIIRQLAIAHRGIALGRIFSFLSEPEYTLSQNSAPRNRTAAYTSLPLATRLYAISQQRTSNSRWSVYFPSFRNPIIRYLITARREISLRRIFSFLSEPDYTPACNSSPQIRTGAYTSLPFRTRLCAISSQLTSKSHCSVYFPSFRNQIIRYLARTPRRIMNLRIFLYTKKTPVRFFLSSFGSCTRYSLMMGSFFLS